MAGHRLRSWRLAVLACGALGCTSAADLQELYTRGIKAGRAGEWGTAVPDLEAFTAKTCVPPRRDPHCREAYLALGRGYERRGTPQQAWVAFDSALALPPHTKDAAVRGDLERAQQEVADKRQEKGDLGPLILRYRDEVTDELTPRSVTVSVDFDPVYTKDRGAADLRSPDFTKIYGGLVPAGTHILVVEAAHSCRPTEGVRCTPSVAHHAWTFESQAKTPVVLELRTFAEPGEGDAPARPTVEMKVH
jgi:hypothetical protein